jgi:hypothetical protein
MGGWEWAIPQSPKISLAADALLTALRGTEIYKQVRGPQQQKEHGLQYGKAAKRWPRHDPSEEAKRKILLE